MELSRGYMCSLYTIQFIGKNRKFFFELLSVSSEKASALQVAYIDNPDLELKIYKQPDSW